MTARSIRRAAERKARKASEKEARLQQLAARHDEPAVYQRREDSSDGGAERKARKASEKEARLQQLAARHDEPAVYQRGEDPINGGAERKAKKASEKESRLQPTKTEPISESRLAANRANSQLSTGPRSAEGKVTSSMNAVKTGLTGRTVLLPSDDAEAYQQHLFAYESEFHPIGLRERELVQSLADIQWRLQRIPGLEMAIYARGREEFAEKFEEQDPAVRCARLDLETFLQYQKPLRNLQIQEGRLQRQREKDMAELRELQEERRQTEQPQTETAALPSAASNLNHLNRILDKANLDDPNTLASIFQLRSALLNRDREEAAAA